MAHAYWAYCNGCGKAMLLPLPANPGWKYCRDCIPLEDRDADRRDPENALRTRADVESELLGIDWEE